jgi:oligosaccharide translocation protein RFT1
MGALSYALARVFYSILFVLLNYYYVFKENNGTDQRQLIDFLPTINGHFDNEYLNLVKAYYTQSIFKQILTQGERYLISAFHLLSISESGFYDTITNLGSLIARFIFLPIEDASYIYFTNSLKRGIEYKQQPIVETLNKSTSPKALFELITKAMSLFGILVCVYGQSYSYSRLVLSIYGSKFSENVICINMLRLYCVYILFLAINGITEAFFNATMSEKQLKAHNYRLVIFSAIFLTFTFILVQYFHIYGFILANCINMLIRIIYSSEHISRYFAHFTLGSDEAAIAEANGGRYKVYELFMPCFQTNLVIGASFIVIKLIEVLAQSFVVDLIMGAFLFVITCGTILIHEDYLSSRLLKFFKNKTSGSQVEIEKKDF